VAEVEDSQEEDSVECEEDSDEEQEEDSNDDEFQVVTIPDYLKTPEIKNVVSRFARGYNIISTTSRKNDRHQPVFWTMEKHFQMAAAAFPALNKKAVETAFARGVNIPGKSFRVRVNGNSLSCGLLKADVLQQILGRNAHLVNLQELEAHFTELVCIQLVTNASPLELGGRSLGLSIIGMWFLQ
jgi:hypothetical protein